MEDLSQFFLVLLFDPFGQRSGPESVIRALTT